MIKNIDKYLDALLSSKVSLSGLEDSLRIIKSNKELEEALDNPNVLPQEKQKIIDDIMLPSAKAFINDLAKECKVYYLEEIIEAYIGEADKRNHIADATVYCVTMPDEEQYKGIRDFICKETDCVSANITVVIDKELIGGFIIHTGGKEFDFSIKGKLASIKKQFMKTAKESSTDQDSVIAVLRKDIKDFEHRVDGEEFGSVVRVGDSIATITGLEHAMYGEIVIFENGVKGMVQDIKRHQVGVIIFGSDVGIHQGSKVKRTHSKAGIPCGENYIGRVVDSLGEPIDGKGEIEADSYRLVENDAPSIVDRKSVSEPLATGILAIDSMFPIGRGQRELIIGDRQTGKTSIAIDTILNQKGKNCICVYNAIGQKA